MKNNKKIKAVTGTAFIFFCCCLSGCSVSFCGLQVGGKKEMAFSCTEEVVEEKGVSQAADSEEKPLQIRASEDESPVSATSQGTDSEGKVNLNSAGVDELMTLNGIGESRAKAIIEYRTRNGPFSQIEDIMQVSGIKEGVFSKIQDQIVVH